MSTSGKRHFRVSRGSCAATGRNQGPRQGDSVSQASKKLRSPLLGARAASETRQKETQVPRVDLMAKVIAGAQGPPEEHPGSRAETQRPRLERRP